MKTQIEYERKFLLTGMPKDVESWDKLAIWQYYVTEVTYKLVTSTYTQQVVTSGKDDDIDVFKSKSK